MGLASRSAALPEPGALRAGTLARGNRREAQPAQIRVSAVRSRSASVRRRKPGAHRVGAGAGHAHAAFPVLAGFGRTCARFAVGDAASQERVASALRTAPMIVSEVPR